MKKRSPTRRHSYDAAERKTFRNALCHLDRRSLEVCPVEPAFMSCDKR